MKEKKPVCPSLRGLQAGFFFMQPAHILSAHVLLAGREQQKSHEALL